MFGILHSVWSRDACDVAYTLLSCFSSGGARGGSTEGVGSQVAAWEAWDATGAAEEDLATGDTQTREFIQFSFLETVWQISVLKTEQADLVVTL
jgi:hypothetical protein